MACRTPEQTLLTCNNWKHYKDETLHLQTWWQSDDWQTGRQTDRQTDTDTDRRTYVCRYIHTYIHTRTHARRQTDRQTQVGKLVYYLLDVKVYVCL